jgi:hypothetical protein
MRADLGDAKSHFLLTERLPKRGPDRNVEQFSSQSFDFIGAGCRIRTRDLLITNQLLYQLS